jgi:hypothetical protein
VAARIAPWLRLHWWANGLAGASSYVEWTTTEHPDFSPDRRAYFTPAREEDDPRLFMPMGGGGGKLDRVVGETRTMIPVYRVPGWSGTITRVRLQFDNPSAAKLVIKSFHTACDTRHTIYNSTFIRGSHDYFLTRNITFLRDQIDARRALRFMEREFDTRRRRCYTTWPGQKTQWRALRDGKKQIVKRHRQQLLDLLLRRYSGHIYYQDAVRDLADRED